MDCKHLKVVGNTTKYYYCKAKDEVIDKWKCENCPLKLTAVPQEIINTLFGGFKGK